MGIRKAWKNFKAAAANLVFDKPFILPTDAGTAPEWCWPDHYGLVAANIFWQSLNLFEKSTDSNIVGHT
ncbi:hypothetical protein EVAR_47266_1 [Eumeta japonica]|uniref:Uncharacterized protein n=1 Tax=Eumeta variegata TaxID=151549 RepID=A0A4C1XEN1_EUMVA|nr:hypothetical protein EVAR_47266_1 [Eumeta japonica]